MKPPSGEQERERFRSPWESVHRAAVKPCGRGGSAWIQPSRPQKKIERRRRRSERNWGATQGVRQTAARHQFVEASSNRRRFEEVDVRLTPMRGHKGMAWPRSRQRSPTEAENEDPRKGWCRRGLRPPSPGGERLGLREPEMPPDAPDAHVGLRFPRDLDADLSAVA